MLPKTAGSAQTHKSISFIWMFGALYMYISPPYWDNIVYGRPLRLSISSGFLCARGGCISKIVLVVSEESYSDYCASRYRVTRISILWGIGVYWLGNSLKVLITEQTQLEEISVRLLWGQTNAVTTAFFKMTVFVHKSWASMLFCKHHWQINSQW